MLPTVRITVDRLAELAIDGGDASREPADMRPNLRADRWCRVLQAIHLGRAHVAKLPTTRDQRRHALPRGARTRPRRRPHAFREERQEVCIEAIRLRELACRLAEIAYLPGIDDDDRQ